LGFEPAEAALAEFPPAGPEAAEVGAGGVRSLVGGKVIEEAGDTEEEGLAVEGILFEEGFEGEALGEDGEGALVVAVAEGLGEGLENGLGAPVGGDEGLEAVGLEAEAMLGGAFDEIGEASGVHVPEGGGAAAEAGGGEAGLGGGVRGEHGAGDAELGDLGMEVGAGEEALVGGSVEEDVEDDVLVIGIGAVVMALPVAGVGIELDVSGDEAVIEADGAAGEVGSGTGIPGAEVFDEEGAAVGGSEGRAEGAGEPEALEIELAKGRVEAGEGRGIFCGGEDGVTEALVAVSEGERDEAHGD
jgi:hypothetical protein